MQRLADHVLRHEKPSLRARTLAIRPQPDTHGDDLFILAELQPTVAASLLVAAVEQVALHGPVLAGERIETPRVDAAVEHKGHQQLQGLGFA